MTVLAPEYLIHKATSKVNVLIPDLDERLDPVSVSNSRADDKPVSQIP